MVGGLYYAPGVRWAANSGAYDKDVHFTAVRADIQSSKRDYFNVERLWINIGHMGISHSILSVLHRVRDRPFLTLSMSGLGVCKLSKLRHYRVMVVVSRAESGFLLSFLVSNLFGVTLIFVIKC